MSECMYYYISEEIFFIAGECFILEHYITIIIGHILELFIQ